MIALAALAVVAVVSLPGASASACTDSAACLREIGEAQKQLRSLSARFVQTKHLALLEEPIVSTGTFAFKQPGQVLWKIDDPAFEVKIDGSKIQLPPGEDAGMRAMPPGLESLLGAMSAVFTGDIDAAARRFDMRAGQDGNDIVVRMSPKSEADRRLLGDLRLTFARPDLTLRAVRLQETVGDSVDIVFRDVHRNDGVADAAMGAAK
jgi:outer membrane lipoprotein-sorting protein